VRGLVLVLALVVTALLIPATALAGGGATRFVDADGHAGPLHGCDGNRRAFTKIQAAIRASAAEDTVVVCPGRYDGFRVVGHAKDGLTVRAAGPGVTILPRRGSVRAPDSFSDGYLTHPKSSGDGPPDHAQNGIDDA
jgi:hypothetical protein